MNTTTETAPAPFPIMKFWIGIGLLIAVVFGGSFFLSTSLNRTSAEALPLIREIRDSFTATERLGPVVDFADLKGKVCVVAYTYSRCPHGCAGVAMKMLKLRDRYQGNPNLQLVCVAAWPEIDSPATLNAFAQQIGVHISDPWWWLSTDRDTAWNFMTDQIGFAPSRAVPANQKLNPEDHVEHDLRVALVDADQRVRGYYAVMHLQTEIAELAETKLQRDIDGLLAK